MPEKRCEREDCGRVFDVESDEMGAESVRCPHCGYSQPPPAGDDTAGSRAETTRLSAEDGVVVTITIEIEPRG